MRFFSSISLFLTLLLSFALVILRPFSALADPPPGAIAALNFSPTGRTIAPVAIQSLSGSVTNPTALLSGSSTRLSGLNSYIVIDFGKDIGGTATVSLGGTSDASQQVGVTFSESPLFVGLNGDSTNPNVPGSRSIRTAPTNATFVQDRGGFRYMTIFMASNGWIDVNGVSLSFSAANLTAVPSAYANYFYSSDNTLNRIWYAGAYTVQLDTMAQQPWKGSIVLLDGAKRDHGVWPGDLGISTPASYVSTNELLSTRNSLNVLYSGQAANGQLPYVGNETPGPANPFTPSDTYHMWTLIGTALYYDYTRDTAWLNQYWARYKLGVDYITGKVDGSSLLNVTDTLDWARLGQGGENIEANAMLYKVYTSGAVLADALGETNTATIYRTRAATLMSAANAVLWDGAVGMYKDNPTSSVYPQDGNALAIWFGLVDSEIKADAVVNGLATRWNSIGAVTPEKPGAVNSFSGAMETLAHFGGYDDVRGMELIRRQWGFMLNSSIGTGSTFWEGMKTDGSFDYEFNAPGFTSLAHGWSVGPTPALTFYVLGLSPQPGPGRYQFVPHPGNLTSTEGRITLPQGALNGGWSRNVDTNILTMTLSSPVGTNGMIAIPKLGGTQVTIAINNQQVWNDGVFTARPGVGGSSEDNRYVYLTGVTPGTYALQATGVGGSGELQSGFALCADEGVTCSFTGTRRVAFGAGNYTYRTITGGSVCNVESFGRDPAPGLRKSCYVAPVGGPNGYTLCATESGSCAVSGPTQIAFGANGAFTYKTVTTTTFCSVGVLGDPISGLAKSCYLPPAAGPASYWAACSTENQTCTSIAGQPIAFGAKGAFTYSPSTNSPSCTTSALGDPITGVIKACYLRNGSPNGFATGCAAEGQQCVFTGQRTVAFGGGGKFIYRTFTNGAPCTAAAFGTDPIHGIIKSCFITA